MKKNIKKTIISLALCASAACVVSGVSFMRSEQETAYAANGPVYSDKVVKDFKIDETSSIRNTSPSGIRFKTTLTDKAEAAIDALGLTGTLSYGTLMIPADMLGSEPLTHKTKNVLDSKADSWQLADENGDEWWTSALVGSVENNKDLPESYYNRPIVARSYVTDGNTVYYTENTATRSIGYTAYMEYLAAPEKATELISNIVSKTKVELVFNDEGMISYANESDAEGLSLISNSLNASSDEFAKIRIGGMLVPDAADELTDPETGKTFFPTITYTSENLGVISVTNNNTTLTANKAGNAVITASVTFNGKELSISKNVSTTEYKNSSEYKILTSAEATEYEQKAATLMQQVLAEATGVELPIVTSVDGDDKYISVGETAEALANTTLTVTAETASQMFVDDGNVYFRGVEGKAILYGVQQFLTEYVGYEYLMENTYSVETGKELIIPTEGATFVRDITYNRLQGNAKDGYGAESYSEGVIPVGIAESLDYKANPVTTDAVQYGATHHGVAHNSVLVVNPDDKSLVSRVSGSYPNTYDSSTSYNSSSSTNSDHWYATFKPSSWGSQRYYALSNPHKDDNKTNEVDPFATYSATVDEKGNITYTMTSQPKYLRAELCYTAHGNATAYAALVEEVAGKMYTELKRAGNENLDRIGFSHMDHRLWCQCTSCTSSTNSLAKGVSGNPSDNLMAFLLDVAAAVKTKLGTDPRAETFKISSLFYHATLPAPKNVGTNAYTTQLQDYGKHIEIWFAESGADYTVGMTDNEKTNGTGHSQWNDDVLAALKGYKALNDTYCSEKVGGAGEMDILWWGYYGMVTQFFVPYDSIDALRINYGVAADNGVDHMFNQMMGSKVNFTRLKEYLMGKLTWDAKPSDDTWNGWIESYFDDAYGAGGDKMQAYFGAWQDWAQSDTITFTEKQGNKNVTVTVKDSFLQWNKYDSKHTGGGASIWNDTVLNTDAMPLTTLENWIELIDQAIAALDPNDPNYETYYWNIKLEKLTPLYLIMWVYGGNTGDSSNGQYTNGTFTDSSYIQKYGAEFLEIAKYWNVSEYREGQSLDEFKTGIQTILTNASASSTTVNAKQTVFVSAQSTLESEALAYGTYTATFTSASDVLTLTNVSVSNHKFTFTAGLTAGETYVVELKSGAKSVKFTNVLAISGHVTTVDQLKALSGNGYYVLANDINCAGGALTISNFSGTLDGNNNTISNFTVGNNGIFGSNKVTLKNVAFDDITASSALTESTLFGTDASFNNVSVDCENANLNTAWSNGININHVKAEKNAYVVSGETTTTLYGNFVKGNTYTVTIDGIDATYTAYSNSKLVNVRVGSLIAGAKKTLVCRDNANGINYGFDVIGATKFITTAQELKELGVGGTVRPNGFVVGNGAVEGKHVEGYYVLANDIDAKGVDFAAGNYYVNAYFMGTFDGNGYTVSNVKVSEGGIFGAAQNATIKNVNFKNVLFHANEGKGFGTVTTDQWNSDGGTGTQGTGLNNNVQWGFYTGILGGTAVNVEVSDVTIQVSEYYNTGYHGRTSLLFLSNKGSNRFSNIMIDAAGLDVSNVLGAEVDASDVYENVTIYVKSSKLLGSAGGMDSDPAASDGLPAEMFDAKDGVNYVETSFRFTNTEKEIAAGDELTLKVNDDPNNDVTYEVVPAIDGVSVAGSTLTVDEDVAHNTQIKVVATLGDLTATYTLTVVGTVELDDTVMVSIEDKTMSIVDSVKGEVQSVTLDGTVLYDGMGDVRYENGKGIYTLSEAVLANVAGGEYDNIYIKTSTARYEASAKVITKYIRTIDDLKALGVGGNNPTMTQAEAKDITGYYVLANDINVATHEEDYSDMVAAGYPYLYGTTDSLNALFKGTFDGNGHTINNLRVSDGGIFGKTSNATIKNVNFTNVYYVTEPTSGVTNVDGGYVALLAHSAQNVTIENINVTVASAPSDWYWKRIGMLVCSGSAGAATYRNITIDAGGLSLRNVLGISVNSGNVYDNVTVIANGYTAIGYDGDSYGNGGVDNVAAKLPEWPTGVTFITKGSLNFVALDQNDNTVGAKLSTYTGDVKALGFAEGTTVYEQLQDNRTSMWAAGTALGLSMEKQGIRLQKAASEDYASVQFSVSRAFSGTNAFFAWIWMPGETSNRLTNNQYVRTNGTGSNEYVKVCDVDGNAVTSFEVGKAYEMRWYHEGAIAFRVGCCEQNGEHITIYYANPSSGNDHTWERNNGAWLPTYDGDVTELGFDAGTSVVEATFATDWDTAYAKRVHLIDIPSESAGYNYMDIQFAVSGEARFMLWDGCAGGGISYVMQNGKVTKNEDRGYDRTVQILNKDGNAIAIDQFAANTVYTLRVYLYDTTEAAHYVGNWQMTSASDVVLYLGDVTYGTVVPDVGGDEDLEEDTISENVLVDLKDNLLTLPDEIDATSVTSIEIDGVIVYNAGIGSIDGNVVTIGEQPNVGADKEIIIKTNTTIYTGTATVATQVIKTAEQLKALGVGGHVVNGVSAGNGAVDGKHVEGYFVLGNNIDGTDVEFAAGYAFTNARFKGVFDGNGYTVSNVMVGDGGIFGAVEETVIKNVNFKNVLFHGAGAPTLQNSTAGDGQGLNNNYQWGLYTSVLGYSASNVEVSDVTITVTESYFNNLTYAGRASLLFTGNHGHNTYKNITIDATGISVANVLGAYVDAYDTYTNVSVIAGAYTFIGKSEGTEPSSDTALTAFPAGVTYERRGVIKQDVQGGTDHTYQYEGDVTQLGFAAGTDVFVVEQDTRTSMWSAGTDFGLSMERQKVFLYKDAKEDYASVLFSFDKDANADVFSSGFMFFAWSYDAMSGGTCYTGYFRTDLTNFGCDGNLRFGVYNLDGTVPTSVKANTVYEMRCYGEDIVKFGVGICNQSEAGSKVTVYYTYPTSGNFIDIDETVVTELSTGSFTLPEAIDGEVTSVTVDGVTVYNKDVGSINGKDVSIGNTLSVGDGKIVLVTTSNGVYRFELIVADKFIRTLDDLKELGVGGNRTNTANITGYYVLANDINVETHADDYSDLVAAGYPKNGDYSFTGTFNGNGYTIDNMRVSDGGIFGIMRGTVKNLNLTHVHVLDSVGSVSNQGGAYASIIANVAPYGTIENINISVATYPSEWEWKRIGLLVNAGNWGPTTFRDITVDASGLKLKNALGTHHNSNNVYENVTVIAMDYTAIGYTGDSYLDGVENVAAKLTEWPTGVTFIAVSKPKTNTKVDLPIYDGDVKALGFAEGTTVYTGTQENGVWADRILLTMNCSYAYAEFDIVLGASCSYLQMWPAKTTASTVGQFEVYTDRVNLSSGDITPEVMIFDAEGNQVTSGSFAANTRYTIRISINDAATSDQYQFAPGATQTYYISDVRFIEEP